MTCPIAHTLGTRVRRQAAVPRSNTFYTTSYVLPGSCPVLSRTLRSFVNSRRLHSAQRTASLLRAEKPLALRECKTPSRCVQQMDGDDRKKSFAETWRDR